MMLTARFQAARLQPAMRCGMQRRGALQVVAFKNGDDELQQVQKQEMSKTKVTFQLPLHVEYGQEVALVGAADSLGAWDVEKSVPMSWNDGDFWTAEAELPTDTAIEYKYVIRAGEGEVKAVVQWQPCNNLEVQAAPAQELTIRDAWEGEQHEVLPGTLPLPAPPATEPEPQVAEEEAPAAFTEAVTVEEPAAVPVVAEAAAAPEEVPEVVAAAAPAVEDVMPAAPAAVEAPETIKAAESATPAAAPGPRRRRSTTSSRSANGSKPVNGSNGSRKVVAAATTEGAPTVKYGSLTTHELKEVCKERGISAKGQDVGEGSGPFQASTVDSLLRHHAAVQRKDLLARLAQLLNRGQA